MPETPLPKPNLDVRRGSSRPFRLVVWGMAIAFASLFLTWEQPKLSAMTPMWTPGRAGSGWRIGHWEYGPGSYYGGGNGFQEAGPVVITLILTFFVVGLVAMRRRSKLQKETQKPTSHWPAFLCLAGLAVMTWNALIYLSFANLGRVVYLAGIALAGVGGGVVGVQHYGAKVPMRNLPVELRSGVRNEAAVTNKAPTRMSVECGMCASREGI